MRPSATTTSHSKRLEIVKARPNLFNDWLKAKGKLGGQHKVPRLSNNRKNIDELLEMNTAKSKGSERI